jgi:hypothetical protein
VQAKADLGMRLEALSASGAAEGEATNDTEDGPPQVAAAEPVACKADASSQGDVDRKHVGTSHRSSLAAKFFASNTARAVGV